MSSSASFSHARIRQFEQRFWFVAATVAITVGAYLRFKGLGTWPLTTDEYYIAKSVQHVSETGLPAQQCAVWGYYLRGLSYQYLAAPLLAMGLQPELALRSLTVLANLIALSAVFVLGNQVGGRITASIASLFFALSMWEIEFARFARMYAPFQAVFMWYLVFLYRVVVGKRDGSKKWMFILSFVGLFTWEGGIFLTVLNFLPLILRAREVKFRYIDATISIMIVGFGFFLLRFDPGFFIPGANLPAGLEVGTTTSATLVNQNFLWSTFSSHLPWAVLFVLPAVASIWATYRIIRLGKLSLIERIALIGVVMASLTHLFTLAVGLLSMILIAGWLRGSNAGNKALRYTAIGVLANAFFWLAFGFFTDTWHSFFQTIGPDEWPNKLLVLLFKFPNVFDTVLFQWLEAMPIFVGILSVLCAIVALFCIFRPRDESLDGFRLLLIVGIVLVFVIGTTQTSWTSSRYSFFLYPLVLVLCAGSVNKMTHLDRIPKVVGQVALVLIVTIILIVSEDFSFAYATSIDTPEVNFRLKHTTAEQHYLRLDFRTPAQFVNRHAKEQDIVIISNPTLDFYLERFNYMYTNHQLAIFGSRVCEQGRTDKWTGKPILYTVDQVSEIVSTTMSDVWIVSQSRFSNRFDEELAARYTDHAVFSGIDGGLTVYQVKGSDVDFSR